MRYRTIAFLAGYADSPDSLARHESLRAEAANTGARLLAGPHWSELHGTCGGHKSIRYDKLAVRYEATRHIAAINGSLRQAVNLASNPLGPGPAPDPEDPLPLRGHGLTSG